MASPLKIMIGLHYYTTPTEYSEHDHDHRNSEAVLDAVSDFVAAGLLKVRNKPSEYGSRYEATEGLEVWVKGLCDVRWPVQTWIIPSDVGNSGKPHE